MKRILLTLTVTAVGVFVAVTAMASTSTSSVGVHRTSHGRVLVDGRGRALYLFERDKANSSRCTTGCLSVWPALTTKGKPQPRAGVSRAKVGTIRAANGRRQVTYSKHPLYSYVGDTKAGETNGQGLNQFGGKWYLVSPSGRKIDDD
jgi:predicted lipoprotein with Yx(FWY)xxD motif